MSRPASGPRSSSRAGLVYRRAGVDYVKLKDGAEVVVQIGSGDDKSVEILAGLKDGDEVVTP